MKNQRLILWLACSTLFFEAMDMSIVNLALPVIAGDIDAPIAQVQWIQTIYVIVYGGFLLLGGRLCDYLGSKNIFLVGMFLFGAASAMAVFSHTLFALILIRCLQGMGAALAVPSAISLLSKHFEEGVPRNRAMGILGSFAGIGFAVGLALGGIITTYLSWHWIFSINVPVITLVLIAACIYIPYEQKSESHGLNLVSSLWLVSTVLFICYAIHELPLLKWNGVLYILISIVSFVLLVWFDRQQQKPFFDRNLYRQKSIIAVQAASLLFGMCFLSYVFVCSGVLSTVFQLSNSTIGFLLFPFSIFSGVVSKYILPKLFAAFGLNKVAKSAVFLMSVGVIFFASGLYFQSLWLVLVSLFIINSFCISIAFPSFTILALSGVTAQQQGIAAGLQSALLTIGTSMGLSMVGFCLQVTGVRPDVPVYMICGFVFLFSVVSGVILPRGKRG